jgi:hypothetical protein
VNYTIPGFLLCLIAGLLHCQVRLNSIYSSREATEQTKRRIRIKDREESVP